MDLITFHFSRQLQRIVSRDWICCSFQCRASTKIQVKKVFFFWWSLHSTIWVGVTLGLGRWEDLLSTAFSVSVTTTTTTTFFFPLSIHILVVGGRDRHQKKRAARRFRWDDSEKGHGAGKKRHPLYSFRWGTFSSCTTPYAQTHPQTHAAPLLLGGSS